jgi:serine/threonine-protein kinase
LSHPNTVRLLDVHDDEEGPALIFEHIEGVSLREVLPLSGARAEPLSGAVAARVCLDLLHGLHALHELRDEAGRPLEAVHRNVTPGNVLVGVDGAARIADMSLAVESARVVRLPSTPPLASAAPDVAPDTTRYVPSVRPPMGSGPRVRDRAVDRRIDLVGVAVILWESLTGQSLGGRTARETMRAAAEGALAERVLAAAGDLPRDVVDLCLRGVAADRYERFPDAIAFARELDRVSHACGWFPTSEAVALWSMVRFGDRMRRQRGRVSTWWHSRSVTQGASR